MSVIIDKTRLSDSGCDFIDEPRLLKLLERKASPAELHDTIAKSMAKQPLSLEETAVLLAADDAASVEQIFAAARQLKRDVYGNRIVLFAPLYIGNECTNDCQYCGFRRSNRAEIRRTLEEAEIRAEIEAMVQRGHKRTILVFGEHPRYTPEYMADCVRTVYSVQVGHGQIRRVNINAAPLDHAGYAAVKGAHIGTYQIFQETYHHETYNLVHPRGTSKAITSGGWTALPGRWNRSATTLASGRCSACTTGGSRLSGWSPTPCTCKSTTTSGRTRSASPGSARRAECDWTKRWLVGDEEFKRLVAVLRLAVPYTGMILTAREPAELRREVLGFGVSQIDAGSRIELGGYTESGDAQVMEREQFQLGDLRPLDQVIGELLTDGYIPSFCTACYRLGRTGEHFMEFAVPGFIQNMCTPNALSTLMEYLQDYATQETYAAGERVIERELAKMPEGKRKEELLSRLRLIQESDARDLYF